MYGMADETVISSELQPYDTAETTTLHLGGGYAGQPVISPTTSGGYQGVSTVNAQSVSLAAQAGNWLSNNLMLAGLGVFGFLFLMGGKRR